MKIKNLLLMLLLLSPFMGYSPVSEAKEPLVVNIDNPNFRKLIIALPKFIVKTDDEQLRKLAQEGPEELTRLLKFSGLFNIMSEKAYQDLMVDLQKKKKSKKLKFLGDGTGASGIDITQWKALGIESLTIGELESGSDGYTLSIRSIDINRGELILGKKYTKIKQNEFSLVIRRYANLLLKSYTGKPGIFSSKMVFVGKRARKSDKQIFICDFDGTNQVQVTNGRYPHLSPNWSHDGRFITYTSYQDGNPDLFLYELATGKTRKLSGYKGINSGSNWAPSDKIVAFTGSVEGNADIYYVPSLGGKRKILIRGSGLDVDPAFSPDGKWMVFVSGRYGNPHIFRARLKWEGSSNLKVVEDLRLTYAGWYNATPSFSPNSDKIAFAGYDKDTDRFDLFMMSPNGKDLERLTLRTGDNESPSWSPNGQMIAFHSSRVGNTNKKGDPHLFIMNRDGSSQRKLNVGLYSAQTPKWSGPLE